MSLSRLLNPSLKNHGSAYKKHPCINFSFSSKTVLVVENKNLHTQLPMIQEGNYKYMTPQMHLQKKKKKKEANVMIFI